MYYFGNSPFGQAGYSYSPINIDPLLKTCYPQNLQPAKQRASKIDSTLAQAADALRNASPSHAASYGPRIDEVRNKLYTHLEAHSKGGCGCTHPNDQQICNQIGSEAEQLLSEIQGLPPAPPPVVASPTMSLGPAPLPPGPPASPDDFFREPLLEPEPQGGGSFIVIGGILFIGVAIALYFLVR